MIVLVRHALAVPRSKWDGKDDVRPLTSRGQRQAAALPPMLSEWRKAPILSSPTTRCTATLEPFASESGTKIKTSRALAEGRGADALDVVLDTVGDLVLCTHGDVVAEVLRGLRELGWPVPARPGKAKGSAWLLAREACAYLRPGA